MPYSQKYTVVQFLGPAPKDVFLMDDWSHHVTLADVFAVDLSNKLLSDLRDFISKQNAFKTKLQEAILLGSEPSVITAIQIKKKPELESLHNGLIDLLEQHGAVFNTSGYTRDGFLPHCTYKDNLKPQSGDVSISQLSLIDMFVDKDWRKRKVIESFRLAKY